MNEDLYLQRLKNIREKYTPASKPTFEIRNRDFIHRPPSPNPELRQRVDITPARPAPEFTRAPITRVERSYSLADNPLASQTAGFDPSQKRMDNFSAFIRDLDQRIEEKERAISSKIRGNEVVKPKEDAEYEVARTLARYGSTRDIFKPPISPLPESISRVVPREAYERSLKREEAESRRGLSSQGIENVLERKWAQEGEKVKLMSGYKGDRLKINQYASPLGLSAQENMGQDNWSIGKLDNIQRRIKAILG